MKGGGEAVKIKMINLSLILIFLFSAFSLAQVMAQCSTCQGTGKVVCPYCEGETLGKPNVVLSGWILRTSEGKVFVIGFFLNNEDFGVYGTPVAEVKSETQTSYTNSSPRTYFPPHEPINTTITIGRINQIDYSYFSNEQFLRPIITVTELDDITCSVCNGTGFVTCPECGDALIDIGGEDQIDDPTIDGETKEEISISFPFDWTIIGVGAVAAEAIAAFVLVKRKKVTEKDLRGLSSNEFQNWVIQRLLGKASSPRDSRIGTDGYTAEGHPIKIMQSDNIGGNVIDNFASVIGRIKAKNGIVVAFSFSDDVYRGIVRAKRNYRIEIKKVTVKELIESRQI